MLLSECKPRIEGETLRLELPGRRPQRGEIASWATGWTPSIVRNGRRVVSYFWGMDFLNACRRETVPPAVAEFIDAVPGRVRERIAKFQFGQCFMLQQAATHPAATELLIGNPMLLWIVACAVYDNHVDPDEVPRLYRRKQVEILRRVLPLTKKAALRLLSRTEIELGTIGEARVITHAVSREPIVAATAHEPRIRYGLLEVLGMYPRLAEFRLSALLEHEFARGDYCSTAGVGARVAEVVGDLERMSDTLGVERREHAIAGCKSIADLHRLHDRWMVRLNRRARRNVDYRDLERPVCARRAEWPVAPSGGLVFPPPPFPDSDDIQAIRTADDLVQEGWEQQRKYLFG